MSSPSSETLTLAQAKTLIKSLAHEQSLLLLSPPGVGKSATVAQAAAEGGLKCRSLLGTQIAPEDVSGIPRIVGERSVFCPPRVVLPENPEPFCLFLDELPACAPDVQKAFYSLLLERRLGEHTLPQGSWVVAAGNRAEDRALVRAMSSALVNRVFLIHVRVDLTEWLIWAASNGIRADVQHYLDEHPDALLRPVPSEPVPFSTPRAWASLSRALDWAYAASLPEHDTRRVLAAGLLSAEDATDFCSWAEQNCPRPETRRNMAPTLDSDLSELELTVRALNYLAREGIYTVADLVVRTEAEIFEIVQSRQNTFDDIKTKLAALGLHLGMRV